MAFNKAISALFTGATSDGTNLTIPIASISGLLPADVDATTGDWREFIFNLLNHLNSYYYSLDSADQPQYCVPQKSSNLQNENIYVHTFNVNIRAASAEESVVDEV